MVPVPLAVVVEGDDEDIRVLERLKPPRGVGALEHVVAKRPAHPIEDGGPREELELASTEPREMLGAQVVGDEPVVSSERDERVDVSWLLHRQRREVEAGDPPLRLAVEPMRVRLGDLDLGRCQERTGLRIAQCQIRGTHLHELPIGSHARQGRAALGPPGENKLRAARQVLRERLERVHAVGVPELVHIVEHEHDRLRHRGQRRAQSGQPGRPKRVACRRRAAEHRDVDWMDAVERRRDVGQERDGIVVAFLEGNPSEGPRVASRPLSDECGLAVSGRRRDADHSGIG